MTHSDEAPHRTAPHLITSILSDQHVKEFVRDPAVRREIEKRLVDVRTARGASVTWWGINGTRVDFGVRAQEDEWRIVYGIDDDELVDWLSVYRRPHPFDGVVGGRAVIVNGASGAGKSWLLDALQRQSQFPWVVFDEPVLGSVNQSYLIWRDQAGVLPRVPRRNRGVGSRRQPRGGRGRRTSAEPLRGGLCWCCRLVRGPGL